MWGWTKQLAKSVQKYSKSNKLKARAQRAARLCLQDIKELPYWMRYWYANRKTDAFKTKMLKGALFCSFTFTSYHLFYMGTPIRMSRMTETSGYTDYDPND